MKLKPKDTIVKNRLVIAGKSGLARIYVVLGLITILGLGFLLSSKNQIFLYGVKHDHPFLFSLGFALGADVKSVDSKGIPVLVYSVLSKKLGPEAVFRLLQMGADPNFGGHGKLTPLDCAVSLGTLRDVKLLLKWGASVDGAGSGGEPPLLRAIEFKRVEIAEALVLAGANPDNRTRYGETPLFCASARGLTRLVDFLICHGAKDLGRSKRGETALTLAKGLRDQRLIELLEPLDKSAEKKISNSQ